MSRFWGNRDLKIKRHSLSVRIVVLSMVAMICSILVIGGIGIYAVKSEGDRDTSRHLNLICDDRSKRINEFLMSVEQSVGMAARYAAEDISSVELVAGGVIGASGEGFFDPALHPDAAANERLESYLAEHAARVLAVIHSAANHTRGVSAYYYYLNPEFRQHRTIRLRHLLENLRSDFVTFS